MRISLPFDRKEKFTFSFLFPPSIRIFSLLQSPYLFCIVFLYFSLLPLSLSLSRYFSLSLSLYSCFSLFSRVWRNGRRMQVERIEMWFGHMNHHVQLSLFYVNFFPFLTLFSELDSENEHWVEWEKARKKERERENFSEPVISVQVHWITSQALIELFSYSRENVLFRSLSIPLISFVFFLLFSSFLSLLFSLFHSRYNSIREKFSLTLNGTQCE